MASSFLVGTGCFEYLNSPPFRRTCCTYFVNPRNLNTRSTGRPASGASLACQFPSACGLRRPVTSNGGLRPFPSRVLGARRRSRSAFFPPLSVIPGIGRRVCLRRRFFRGTLRTSFAAVAADKVLSCQGRRSVVGWSPCMHVSSSSLSSLHQRSRGNRGEFFWAALKNQRAAECRSRSTSVRADTVRQRPGAPLTRANASPETGWRRQPLVAGRPLNFFSLALT
jgi:hypothetical protein